MNPYHVRNPDRYAAAILQRRDTKPAPTDLTGVTITVCPPGEAKNAARLAGITGADKKGRGGRKGKAAAS
jgi:hypothetical protein